MLLRAAFLIVLAQPVLLGQGPNAVIVGQVRDERLRPIHGARINADILPQPGARVRPFQATTLTAANGGFQFRVPAGTFRVCAHLRGTELLDPCTWSDSPPRAVVGPGQRVALPPILLKRGYPLRVRLEDPGRLLPGEEKKRAGARLMVGVSARNGMFLPMPVRRDWPGRREHELFVPRDTALWVSVHSRGFTVADDRGAPIDARKAHRVPVKLEGQRSRSQFVFRITGVQARGTKK